MKWLNNKMIAKKTFPKVTVVTVTYNAQDYLEKTIKSIMAQEYLNLEYIIIDGLSTDKTVNIIKQYEQYIDYWISEADNGIYDAMNKAIAVATGEWINFMNAGDCFSHSNTLLRTFADDVRDIDLICGNINYGNEGIYQTTKGLEFQFKGMFCFHQATFVKTTIMKNYLFDTTFIIAADYDFLLKCSMHGYKFKFVDYAIANYIGDGISQLNSIKARVEDLFIQAKYLTNLEDIYSSNSLNELSRNKKGKNLDFRILYADFHKKIDTLLLHNKKFILYGFGTIGEMIYKEYKNSILCIVDKNFQFLSEKNNIDIHNPDILFNKYHNEYILITAFGMEKEIYSQLISKYCINKNYILEINLDV